MNRVLVVGAGGHAAVVVDALLASRAAGEAIEVVGCLDDNRALVGTSVLGVPVIGPPAGATAVAHDTVVIAIGDNRAREDFFHEFNARNEQFTVVRHPSAVLGSEVTIGAGTLVGPGVVINCRAVIGENVILNSGCIVEHDCRVGQHAHVAPGVRLAGGVRVGVGTLVGVGAIVMPGRSVGNWCRVGAGAVVHRDVPDGLTVVGIPAQPLPAHTER